MNKIVIFIVFLTLLCAVSGAITLDGTLDATGYTLLYSTTANARTGFGSGDDCSAIYYAYDFNSIYFFVQGKIDGAGNGLLLLVGSSATSGYPAGYNLGNTNSGNAIFSLGAGGGGNWEMDFPVSAGIYINSFNGNTTLFVNDAAYYLASSFATSGFISSITSGQVINAPGTSGVSGCSLSYNTSGNTGGPGLSTGLEVAFPRVGSPLGTFTTAGYTLQAFAIIVGNNTPPGYFSNDGVPTNFPPGTTSNGNWGQNPNFGNGPCHITTAALPSGGAGGSSPTINGTLDASGYTLEYSTTTNARTGFAGTECSALYYTYDANSVYFFVQSELNGSGDGIVLLVGSSATSGYQTGWNLGDVPSASSNGIFTLGAGSNGNWAMDFPVNAGIFVDAYGGTTPGNSNLFYVNDAIYYQTSSFATSGFINGINSNGGVVTAPGTSGVSNALVSFNNSGNAGGPGNSTGLEVAFPRSGSALGSLTTGVTLQAIAIVVNNSGYFSNEGVPTYFPLGSADGFGNIGFTPNFLEWGEENPGPNHVTTASLPVPVELSNFDTQ